MMPKARTKRGSEALLAALVAGRSVAAAAREAGLSEATAWRRTADPAFQEALREARAAALDVAVRRLAVGMGAAAATLVQLAVNGRQEFVRLQAARAVLQEGLRALEAADLVARLDALERLTETASPPPGGLLAPREDPDG